jgi:hypothetical protein
MLQSLFLYAMSRFISQGYGHFALPFGEERHPTGVNTKNS